MSDSDGDSSVVECLFEGNSANKGGAIAATRGGIVTSCVFRDNCASEDGGAFYNWPDSEVTISNCIFVDNVAAGLGGGMCNYENTYTPNDEPFVVNCTFTRNTAASGGGMHNDLHVRTEVRNCIFWVNTPDELVNGSYSRPNITFCLVPIDSPTGHNIYADPLFGDPLNDDFRLRATSPCIDVGTSAEAPGVDFGGTTRPQGNGVDMGAYEQ